MLLMAVVAVVTVTKYGVVSMIDVALMTVVMVATLLLLLKVYCRWYVLVVVVLAPVVAVFITSPPDNWIFGDMVEPYNEELLLENIHYNERVDELDDTTAIASNNDCYEMGLSDLHLYEGKHVVMFVSPTCEVCRASASKISIIIERHHLDQAKFIYVFPRIKDTTRYEDFYSNSRAKRLQECMIDKDLFLKITKGAFPLVLMMEDGFVVSAFSNRNMDESEILSFLED